MALHPLRARRARREAELEAQARFRAVRRVAGEDVTVLGEQLAALHVETLTDVLTEPMHADYVAALTAYDDAKAALDAAATVADVVEVDRRLDDGRFRLASVLARRDGHDLPQRRDPCFFNPQHGPATRDVRWAPPAGVEREIPVCWRCSERLAGGEPPEHRLVRVGDRWLPWYAAGGSLDELSRVTAHVVRGSGWRSRVNEAEALTRAGTDGGGGWVSGS